GVVATLTVQVGATAGAPSTVLGAPVPLRLSVSSTLHQQCPPASAGDLIGQPTPARNVTPAQVARYAVTIGDQSTVFTAPVFADGRIYLAAGLGSGAAGGAVYALDAASG